MNRSDPERVQARRVARMREIDNLSPELRWLVNKYNYNVVHAFLMIGVSNPRHIRHIVERVLDEFSPTRGASSYQGPVRPEGM